MVLDNDVDESRLKALTTGLYVEKIVLLIERWNTTFLKEEYIEDYIWNSESVVFIWRELQILNMS